LRPFAGKKIEVDRTNAAENENIDHRAVFKELKALGPMALIEVNGDSETVKI
jgi:hypothetical protein